MDIPDTIQPTPNGSTIAMHSARRMTPRSPEIHPVQGELALWQSNVMRNILAGARPAPSKTMPVDAPDTPFAQNPPNPSVSPRPEIASTPPSVTMSDSSPETVPAIVPARVDIPTPENLDESRGDLGKTVPRICIPPVPHMVKGSPMVSMMTPDSTMIAVTMTRAPLQRWLRRRTNLIFVIFRKGARTPTITRSRIRAHTVPLSHAAIPLALAPRSPLAQLAINGTTLGVATHNLLG